MATKKTATKKMVKKPVMKKGGVKKPLRKAKDGEPVYSGPMNKIESDVIDNSKMSPEAKAKARQPFLNPKNTRTEAINKSMDVMDQEWDKNYNNGKGVVWGNQVPKAGPYVSPYHKKGGATKKYEVGGMTESESCGKPGKPRCKKTFKSKGKSKETKGSLLGTIGAGILGSLGGYAAYKKLKEQKKGGATKYKTGGMVNANANLKATATAGSKGVKSGVNAKATASKVARGRSGGTSTAPKKATPGRK